MDYQAKLKAPFGVLGIRCTDDALTGIEFLAPGTMPQQPRNAFAHKICEQLSAYLADADFRFDFPLRLNGTAHRTRVWQAMCAIPRGETRSYGELAKELQSSAQAVGQACGANPIPIVIPCHRVVGKAGLGGFMHHSAGYALDIKRWLLAHEGVAEPIIDGTTDGTTSHLTNPAKDAGQVIGYSHPTKLQKPQQVAGYSAKAGIQSNKSAGFRVKPGMTKSK